MDCALRHVFPDSVEIAACRWEQVPELPTLPPELLALCEPFSEPRRKQFLGGRLCALQALRRLGLPSATLGRGADHEPLWPAGITGSITHSGEWAAAAVARSCAGESLGLDIEVGTRDARGIWRLVLTDGEKRWARAAADEATALRRAILIFSAKEAFYKWQFPRTRMRLGFLDAETRPMPDGRSLRLELLSDRCAEVLQRRTYAIFYTSWNEYLVTGMYQSCREQ